MPACNITMRRVYFGADNIITSLGFTTEENAQSMLADRIGIRTVEDPSLFPAPVPASLTDNSVLSRRFADYDGGKKNRYTRLEQLFILSIEDVVN